MGTSKVSYTDCTVYEVTEDTSVTTEYTIDGIDKEIETLKTNISDHQARIEKLNTLRAEMVAAGIPDTK